MRAHDGRTQEMQSLFHPMSVSLCHCLSMFLQVPVPHRQHLYLVKDAGGWGVCHPCVCVLRYDGNLRSGCQHFWTCGGLRQCLGGASMSWVPMSFCLWPPSRNCCCVCFASVCMCERVCLSVRLAGPQEADPHADAAAREPLLGEGHWHMTCEQYMRALDVFLSGCSCDGVRWIVARYCIACIQCRS